MSAKVKPIPEGYHTVTPYMILPDTAKAIEFYKKAFGAVEMMRMADDSGKVMHAEIKIGDSPIMMADECPQMEALCPKTVGGSPVFMLLYVENVDDMVRRAEAAGAKVIMPVKDQFYGDRSGTVADPFGYKWTIATHVEDVSPEEIGCRAEAFKAGGSKS